MYYSSKKDKAYQIGEWVRGKGLYIDASSRFTTPKDGSSLSKEEEEHEHGHDTHHGNNREKANKNTLDMIFQNDSIDQVTLVVVTKEEKPYVMLREGKSGNEAYEGFAIDLLKVEQKILFVFYVLWILL